MSKFKLFVIAIFAFLAVEVGYLQVKAMNANYELKSNFIKFSKFSDFAFSNGYARHTFLGAINDVFAFHPSYRESEISTFLMPGLGKAYE